MCSTLAPVQAARSAWAIFPFPMSDFKNITGRVPLAVAEDLEALKTELAVTNYGEVISFLYKNYQQGGKPAPKPSIAPGSSPALFVAKINQRDCSPP